MLPQLATTPSPLSAPRVCQRVPATRQPNTCLTSNVCHPSTYLVALLASLIFAGNALFGQMISVGMPFNSYSHSWYERQGVQFGFNLPGGQGGGSRVVGLLPNGRLTPGGQIQFTQGGWGGVYPNFGGYDPFASARFGLAQQGSLGGFRLGLELGQGSTRTLTSTAPSLVVQNGGGGALVSGQWTPFVTGWIPLVGSAPTVGIDNAVTRAIESGQLRLDSTGLDSNPASTETDLASPGPNHNSGSGRSSPHSTAEMATESVAAIRARKAAAQRALTEQLAKHLEDYQQHLEAGRNDLARLALNRAIVLETDAKKKQALRNRLKTTPKQ